MSEHRTHAPSLDALIDRCEAMDWGYEVACWVDYAEMLGGGARIAVDRTCRAEVTEPGGTMVTIDDARTGRDALHRAVTGMERVIAGRVTARRES